jgi:hypothetical protein
VADAKSCMSIQIAFLCCVGPVSEINIFSKNLHLDVDRISYVFNKY